MMEDLAIGLVVGALKGIPQMMQDIQNNSQLSAEKKKQYLEQLAGEVHTVGQQVAAYKFKDV